MSTGADDHHTGASADAIEEEQVAWDEDSDEEKAPSTPQVEQPTAPISMQDNDSTTTIQSPSLPAGTSATLKSQGRKSHDRLSQPDSEESYDLVSGATSHAPGSPKEGKSKDKRDESDEEDWE